MGSDHCPIFTDFKVPDTVSEVSNPKKLKFEASTHYRIGRHYDISSMFQSAKKRKLEPDQDARKSSHNEDNKAESKLISNKKVESKVQRPKQGQVAINSFFTSKSMIKEQLEIEESIKKRSKQTTSETESQKNFKPSQKIDLRNAFGEIPNCSHGQPCQLKTSLNNPKTRGKKFWCCSINGVGLNDGTSEGRCSFFQWLNPK